MHLIVLPLCPGRAEQLCASSLYFSHTFWTPLRRVFSHPWVPSFLSPTACHTPLSSARTGQGDTADMLGCTQGVVQGWCILGCICPVQYQGVHSGHYLPLPAYPRNNSRHYSPSMPELQQQAHSLLTHREAGWHYNRPHSLLLGRQGGCLRRVTSLLPWEAGLSAQSYYSSHRRLGCLRRVITSSTRKLGCLRRVITSLPKEAGRLRGRLGGSEGG